jgi:myo-inositol-1(or 4)-monophosphatase
MIAEAVQENYPADGLISEELQPRNMKADSNTWVIDPLDGTTNYSSGLPIWGVSIARMHNGLPDLGVVYFPFLDEMYTAVRGQGASMNGERIHSQPPVPGKPTSFFSCCTRTHQHYDVSIQYKTRILGSACFSFCAVARGMAVLAFEATPKIWDIAASWLIATESGAEIETIDRSEPFPLRDNFDYRTQSFPFLAAANRDLLVKSRKKIRPKTLAS